MIRLNEKQARAVAGMAGINEKAVHRLVRPLRVTMEEGRFFEIGLGITEPFVVARLKSPQGLERLGATLREYMKTCPKVISWVGRGDFKENQPPASLGRGVVLHASRTAGRLKAALLRELAA